MTALNVTINFATHDDISDLMCFLRDHWSANHILAKHQSVVDWQYGNAEAGGYDVVVARMKESREIMGVLGFIRTRRYDKQLAEETLWMALWKVRDDCPVAGLGLLLHNFMKSKCSYRVIGTVGINPKVVGVYKLLGYSTGTMKHFYALRQGVDSFKLVAGDDLKRPAQDLERSSTKRLRPLTLENFDAVMDDFDDACIGHARPWKSPHYFKSRFLEHPFYDYNLYTISPVNGRPQAILALRCAEHDGCNALRIVDYLGTEESLHGIGMDVQRLLNRFNAEYADIYNSGIDPEHFTQAGFMEKYEDDDSIIPNYFEPFVMQNIPIHFAYKAPAETPYWVFKADADQDRPNSLSESSAD